MLIRRGVVNMAIHKIKFTGSHLFMELILMTILAIGVPLLYESQLSVPFFWTLYIVISLITAFATVSAGSTNLRLLAILIYSFSLHLIIPLVEPVGITWNHDELFSTQAIKLIMSNNVWIPGAGTHVVREAFSYFPGLFIVEAAVSFVSGIDISLIQQYFMLIYSPLFLSIFFLFMKKATDNSNLALIGTYFFATNPIFEYFSAHNAYQGFGYVLVAIILLVSLRRIKEWRYMFLIFSFVLVISHLWSSVILTAFLGVLWILRHLFKEKGIASSVVVNISDILLLVVLFFCWQIFIATTVLYDKADIIVTIFTQLTNLQTAIHGELQFAYGLKGTLNEMFFNYIGAATFLFLGLYGSIICFRNKMKTEAWLFLLGGGVNFINFFIVPWHLVGSVGIRRRIIDYAYLFVVPAAVIGSLRFKTQILSKFKKKGIYLFTFLLFLLTFTTILMAYPQFYYTKYADKHLDKPPNTWYHTEQWVSSANWVNHFVDSGTTIFGGAVAQDHIGSITIREIDTKHLKESLYESGLNNTRLLVIHDMILKYGGDVLFNFTKTDYETALSFNLIYDNSYVDLFMQFPRSENNLLFTDIPKEYSTFDE